MNQEFFSEILTKFASESITSSEKEILAPILNLKTLLLDDKTHISIPDYGAGRRWKRLLGIKHQKGSLKKSTVGKICQQSSKNNKWGLFLYRLTQYKKPLNILELGTCLGISTAYMTAGSPQSSVISIEGAEALAVIAEKNLNSTLNFQNVMVKTGTFDELLPTVLSTYIQEKLDFVFIDGNHEESATLRYWEKILPRLNDNAIVVFDDIHWSKGMLRAWQQVIKNEKVAFHKDLKQLGVVQIQNKI